MADGNTREPSGAQVEEDDLRPEVIAASAGRAPADAGLVPRLSAALSAAAILIAFAALLGWLLGLDLLVRLYPDPPAMHPVSVLCFAALGLSLVMAWHPPHLPETQAWPGTRRALLILALVLLPMLVATAQLVLFLAGSTGLLGAWLSPAAAGSSASSAAHMSLPTAFMLVILSLACLAQQTERPRVQQVGFVLALFGLSIALLALVGHALGDQLFHGYYTGVTSSVLLILIALSLLLRMLYTGVPAIWRHSRFSAPLLIWLIPIGLLLPIALGLLEMSLFKHGDLRHASSAYLQIVGTTLLVLSAVLVTAWRIDALVDEMERANQVIRSDEQRVQRVLDNLYAFVGVLTRDGTLIEANRAPLEAAGIAPDDVIGKRFWDCFWWSYSTPLQERIKTAIARALQGEASRFDAEIRVIGDQRMTIDFMLSPLRDASGKIVELIASAVDVTERCRAENALHALNEGLERKVEERTAALRASEQRFRLAMQNSPIGLAIVGLDGRFLEVNKALCEILGYGAAELIEYSFQAITHPDDLNADLTLLDQLVAGELPTYQLEKRYYHKRGHIVWSQLNVSLVRGDDDTPLYFISKIQDITERKQISSAMEAVSSELLAYEGEAYFQHAVTRAAEIIGADIAFMARYDADEPEAVETLVLVEEGVLGDRLRYRLNDTPCAEVLRTGQGLLLNDGLQRRYPRNTFFVEKAINAYAATPLMDTKGELLGHFCVMRHEPFIHVEAVSQVLNLFSLAAATQLARERNRRQYQDLFELAPDALVMSALDGRLVMANRQAEQLFGYSREALLEQRIEQLLPGASSAQEAALQLGGLEVQGRQQAEQETLSLEARHQNGSVRPVELSYTRLQTESGPRLALAIRDVSERVESNTRLLAMADTLPVLLTYFDRDGLCRMANRTFEHWFQCRAEAVLGQSREALLAAFASKGYRECPEAGTGAATRSVFEAVHRYPDGEERNVEVHYVPHLDAQGGVIGYYTMVVDITERVRTGKQLALSQKMDSIGRLSGGVAHDFNNLLSVIQGNLQLLERSAAKGDIETMATWIGAALDAVSKGADLTKRLLAFSRHKDFADEVIDVKRRVAELDSLLQRIIGEEIALHTHIGERLPSILGDVSQFENALINLAVNARDAMPQGGTLTIEADTIHLDPRFTNAHPDLAAGDYILITVSDTGQGIAPEHIDRVFEPFFTTKGADKGTGLGLASVYGFMKQAKGHVTLYSEVGHGTSVNLYFPIQDLGANDARADHQASAGDGAGSAPLQAKVLVVDDHADVRMLSGEMLRSFGCLVLEASDGPSALRILAEHPDIDLLFTDVVMPGGMNGLELAQQARAASPRVRVLYTSGFTEASATHNRPRVKNSVWLRKPVDIKVLEREVRHILQSDDSSEAAPTSEIPVENISHSETVSWSNKEKSST